MRLRKALIIAFCTAILAVAALITACAPRAPQPQTATGGATQVQDLTFKIPKNSKGNTSEQQNIIDRLRVTTDPTKVLWIHLLSLDGKIIRRMPVTSKVTSSGKRLEPTEVATVSGEYKTPMPSYSGYYVRELLQPDGTFGSSDSYIFWFDPQHRYHQWGTAGGLGYLLTDYPIDLTNPIDEVTGMYNMNLAAFQWQKAQEEQLCTKEGKKYSAGVCQ